MLSPKARALTACLTLMLASVANAQQKPNILVVFGDDISQSNVSAYSMGLMGYHAVEALRRGISSN